MKSYEIISGEKLNEMLEEEEVSGREYLELGDRIEIDGFLYSTWIDTRTKKEYLHRLIRTVHMGFNDNEPGKIEEFIEIVEREGACKASWGVTGRTYHLMLAEQLAGLLPQYNFEIDYQSYRCLAKKVTQ